MNIQFCTYKSSRFTSQTNHLIKGLQKSIFHLLVKNQVIIAGGAITSVFSNRLINDYDLYCVSEKHYRAMKANITSLISEESEFGKKKGKLLCESGNATTYQIGKSTIQLIYTHLKGLTSENLLSMEDILKNFDFTVCMAAYSVSTGEYVLNDKFLEHLAAQKLVFNPSTQYPISSLIRVKKYLKKGFSIGGAELVKIALCVHNVEMTTYQDLKDQLMGIDMVLFKDLTDDLIENHGATAELDYGIIMDFIEEKMNEVFNFEESNWLLSENNSYSFDDDLPFT